MDELTEKIVQAHKVSNTLAGLDTVILLGNTGVGKTTTINIVAGKTMKRIRTEGGS